MTALSVQSAIAQLHAAAPASAVAAPEPEAGFATLLGQFANPPKDTQTRKDSVAAAEDAPDVSTPNLMQSLEAALAGMAAFSGSPSPRAAAPVKADEVPQTTADKAASALSAAAGALAAGAFDASGRTPLKALLAADPTLGLRDFQIKTFLAATGAAPAKTGGTTLGTDSAWSPLDAAKFASALGAAADDAKFAASASNAAPEAALPEVGPAATASARPAVLKAAPPEARLAAKLPLPAGFAAEPAASAQDASPAAIPPPPAAALTLAAAQTAGPTQATPAVVPTPPRCAGSSPASAPARSAHTTTTTKPAEHTAQVAASAPAPPSDAGETSARGGERDAAAADASPVAAASAVSDTAATPTLTVPFAQLPAFIARQAASLAASAPEAVPNAGVASAPTPKAAQAVKELRIALDPGELGEMTLKLRLAGGKLSVTIAVANPQTLGAIEGDRALIAARLGAGDGALEDLVIQRQALPASSQETGSTHASVNDSSAQDRDAKPDSPPPRNGRPGGSRSGAGDGGAFRDFL